MRIFVWEGLRGPRASSLERVVEHARIAAVVVPERELVEVERQVLLADVMEAAHDAAFQQRPEAVNGAGVDDATHVLILVVIH